MTEAAQPMIPHIPVRVLKGHENTVSAVAVFPDRRRMVTGSADKTLRMWDLKDGVLLKKMEGHGAWVRALAVSGDGQLITSGDINGEFIAWDGETGKPLTQVIKAHSERIRSLDLSSDGAMLATGSKDKTTKLWSTATWLPQGDPIDCSEKVYCIRYSPSGELLAVATKLDIQIWNIGVRKCIAKFKAHATISGAYNYSLAWTPDGTRLLSAGNRFDHTIREWDTSTWKQVGGPWTGHTHQIGAIAMNSTGTLLSSASYDNRVCVWRRSDRKTIASFQHSDAVCCVTFSMDGKYVFTGGFDKKVSEWVVPVDALLDPKIFPMYAQVRDACIIGDFPAAEKLLAQEIDADGDNYNSYANRSLVMARKRVWDYALQDAHKSISIQPSLAGCISKGIALCGNKQVQDATRAFDLAFMFTTDPKTIHMLLLIKAIMLFNANQHEHAILRVQELASVCPEVDTVACRIVEAYLRLQLGIRALDDARHNDAADHFTAAVNIIAVSPISVRHSKYEEFVVLFGWDLESLWKNANQKRCHALLLAGRVGEAQKSYRYMMDMLDESAKTSCLEWSTAFKENCRALYAANGFADLSASGDAALVASDYDMAIELYSAAIDLDSGTDIIFANRCKANSEKMLWEDALFDAQKVIELKPSSYLGYQLKHAALHGTQRYDEAIAFRTMLSSLDNTFDPQAQKLHEQYMSPSEVGGAIQKVIDAQMEDAPPRLINTSTGRLCDREAQINTFKTSIEYKKLLSSTMMHVDFQLELIQEVVMLYFRCVMLSHRWERKEPLLHDIQDQSVYELNPIGGIVKLQSFCKVVCDAGYQWAWSDTCCIDKSNNVEVQESVNSMFVWYRHSALTIVYLSDVPPSSKSGALARSSWITRGWTVQEFLAPKVILFYQKDWSLYLDDQSFNHKESIVIMQELVDATGIDPGALVAFRPGMRNAREKLQWASRRITTLQEDIAYSLFGIFGVHLAPIYGEKKQNALGRLLQEIVARSGDISALDWVGKSSEFNSCLPADISAYQAPPRMLPSLSEDEVQTSVSSLRNAVTVKSASKLYTLLGTISVPRFANCRLQLPCIAFRLTAVRRMPDQDRETYLTYAVKADGLHDLLVTTEDKLIPFSRASATGQTFFLVRPWDRHLLDLPVFASNTQNMAHISLHEPPVENAPTDSDSRALRLIDRLRQPFRGFPGKRSPVTSESNLSALRLIVRLGQPFRAILLAQQRGGEYTRIASDQDIIAQVKDMASICNMVDSVRTVEIL